MDYLFQFVFMAVFIAGFFFVIGRCVWLSWFSPTARAFARGYADWHHEIDVSEDFSSGSLRKSYRTGRKSAAEDFQRKSDKMLQRLDQDLLKPRK